MNYNIHKQKMNLIKEQFFEACKKNDVKYVDQLIKEEFPAYIYLKSIFELIFEYNCFELFIYFEKYIQNHLMNEELMNLYSDYLKQYRFFLWMKSEDCSLDELQKIYQENRGYTSYIPCLSPILIVNLMKLDLSYDKLNVIREYFHIYDDGSGDIDKCDIVMVFFNWNDIRNGIWNVIDKLENEVKDIILERRFAVRGTHVMFTNMLKAKNVDLYHYAKKKFQMTTNVCHYACSCVIGDYDLSMQMLREMNIDTEKLFSSRKELNRFRTYTNKPTMNEALSFSIESRNEKLIKFNRELYEKLYNQKMDETYSWYIFEDIDDMIAKPNNVRILDRFIQDICNYPLLSDAKEIDKVMETHIKIMNHCYDTIDCLKTGYMVKHYLIMVFHMCSVGLKDKYETIAKETFSPDFRKKLLQITEFYNSFNKQIMVQISTAEVLNKNVLGLVYQYARF